ncbi:AAA family ATPase [Aureivirga sp. CE67]|uniref:AAA family ATPase n=1 Tax=Aureivirga sp. CE67 TaxID=1788983 RepID=UPI0018CBBE81|nr:ATP-binding protein [Aureivirga sp. CE67]
MQKKVLIIGGPGTGKSTVLNELIRREYLCMPEISREVTRKAQEEGIDQLFLTDPLLFSKMLLEGRIQQYIDAENSDNSVVFFDRGIPDVHAYMNYISIDYPEIYKESSLKYKYDQVFLMPPWEKIYITDNERYESFEQLLAIHNHLKRAYEELGYKIVEVPFGNIEERTEFILKNIN